MVAVCTSPPVLDLFHQVHAVVAAHLEQSQKIEHGWSLLQFSPSRYCVSAGRQKLLKQKIQCIECNAKQLPNDVDEDLVYRKKKKRTNRESAGDSSSRRLKRGVMTGKKYLRIRELKSTA